MRTADSDRHILRQEACRHLGKEAGDILMDHLPPAGWSHLASKDDLALTTAVLRTELADVRTELKTEMADLRTELKTEMAELRTELKTGMAELRVEMANGFKSQTWKTTTAIAASQTVSVAVIAILLQVMR